MLARRAGCAALAAASTRANGEWNRRAVGTHSCGCYFVAASANGGLKRIGPPHSQTVRPGCIESTVGGAICLPRVLGRATCDVNCRPCSALCKHSFCPGDEAQGRSGSSPMMLPFPPIRSGIQHASPSCGRTIVTRKNGSTEGRHQICMLDVELFASAAVEPCMSSKSMGTWALGSSTSRKHSATCQRVHAIDRPDNPSNPSHTCAHPGRHGALRQAGGSDPAWLCAKGRPRDRQCGKREARAIQQASRAHAGRAMWAQEPERQRHAQGQRGRDKHAEADATTESDTHS